MSESVTEVKAMTLVFENCESISFGPESIIDLAIGGLHTEIARYAINSIRKSVFIDEFLLELQVDDRIKTNLFDSVSVSERLQSQDITQVLIEYKDGHHESYAVSYDTGDKEDGVGAPNILQDTYIHKNFVFVCISKSGKHVQDYVDLDAIECDDLRDRGLDLSGLDVALMFGMIDNKTFLGKTRELLNEQISGGSSIGSNSEPNSKSDADDRLDKDLAMQSVIMTLRSQLDSTQVMLRLVQDLVDPKNNK